MKRAILLLAVAASMTGCHTHCDITDLALYWTFSGPAGNQLSCSNAGVANVRVTIDEQPPFDQTFGCITPDVNGNPSQGILLTQFFQGVSYPFQLEGLDANGASIYLDQFVYTPNGYCGAERRDRALTSTAADLTIAYTFQGGGTCTPVTQSPFATTYIWLQLLDQNGQVYSVIDSQNDPTAVGCGQGNATVVIPNAPDGGYTLSGIEEVEILADRSVIVWHYNCVPVSFQHLAPGDVFNAPPMARQATGGQVTCF